MHSYSCLSVHLSMMKGFWNRAAEGLDMNETKKQGFAEAIETIDGCINLISKLWEDAQCDGTVDTKSLMAINTALKSAVKTLDEVWEEL